MSKASALLTSVGLVGLPNVGKSTLFNFLIGEQRALVANYPFATIAPNSALLQVPDPRLDRLAALAKSKKIIRDTVAVQDIAGLVKNASKGEGLGNEFLGHIRGVDAVVHVVRCFADASIIHVHGEKADPVADVETIEMELVLADVASLEKRLQKSRAGADRQAMELAKQALLSGQKPPPESALPGLLSCKPVLYALISDDPLGSDVTQRVAKQLKGPSIVISAQLEAQIAQEPDPHVREELLREFGLDPKTPSLMKFAAALSGLLRRRVFFTVGPMEAHAWAFAEGETAVQAASRIHTDIGAGFIAAEVQDDWNAPVRLEGREYKMRDGDLVHFRHSS
jgi:ribosome-binding ATPase YchF (GTP1/OBG family)